MEEGEEVVGVEREAVVGMVEVWYRIPKRYRCSDCVGIEEGVAIPATEFR